MGIGGEAGAGDGEGGRGGQDRAPVFTKPEEQKVAQIAWEVIRKLENQPQMLPT